MSYRYFVVGVDGNGWQIRHCFSTRKDSEGFFRAWREIVSPSRSGRRKVKRTGEVSTRRAKLKAKELAETRYRRELGERLLPQLAGVQDHE